MKSVIYIALFLLPVCVHTQTLPFRNIGVNEGLPSTEVYSILQDKQGYIWASTDAGVARFNGKQFTVFNITTGLTDNTVFQLEEDKKGRIWMPCFNGTICYFYKGKIHTINANPELSKALGGSTFIIQSIKTGEGDTLLVGTTKSIFKIAPANNYSKLVWHADTNSRFGIEKTNDNVVYYSNGQLPRREYERKFMRGKIFVNGTSFTSRILRNAWEVYLPRFNALWTDGKLLFSQASELYTIENDSIIRLTQYNTYVIAIYRDPQGGLWVGLSKGGVYYYPDGDPTGTYYHFLEENSVSAILMDHEKGLWLTTHEKGIYYSPFINCWQYNQVPGLSGKMGGLYTFKNKLYAANYKNEIYILNERGDFEKLKQQTGHTASNNSFFYENKGVLYFCGHLIFSIDTIGSARNYFTSTSGISISGTAMLQRKDKSFFIGAYGSYFYFDSTGTQYPGVYNLPARASSIVAENEKTCWVGTHNGLYLFDYKTFSQKGVCPELKNERITSITRTTDGRLFVCTRNQGLFIKMGSKWINISTKDGLAGNLCSHVIIDNTNYVWVATGSGLSFFKISEDGKLEDPVKSITVSNGLPTNEITGLVMYNERLYVATRNGLCYIGTENIFYNSVTTVPRIKNPVVKGIASKGQDSEFSYYENELRFYVDCNSYKDMFNPGYFYRLVGFDKNLKFSTNPYIEFLSLPPGKYELQVYGRNNNGVVSKQKSVYSFVIYRPWYFTIWFILPVTLLFAAAVYFFVQFRVKIIKKREEEKTRINKQLAEYRLTALQARMNPHFIFNAINSIQNYILNHKEQEAYNYLAKFSKLIRMVLVHSESKTLTLAEELETIRLYVELEQLRFENSFEFKISMSPEVNEHQMLLPPMLIQPYVENAIGHGLLNLGKERKGKLNIRIISDNKELKIIVEDNGIGRVKAAEYKKESVHKPVAMKLTEQRLQTLNAMRGFEGSRITIEDLADEKGNATGTRVQIVLPV